MKNRRKYSTTIVLLVAAISILLMLFQGCLPLIGKDSGDPSWSPNGQKIVFYSDRGNKIKNSLEIFETDIYIMNADGNHQIKLTNMPGIAAQPMFSPDGTKILFSYSLSSGGDPPNLISSAFYVMDSDGSGLKTISNRKGDSDPTWSPDGSKIAFSSNTANSTQIFIMNADGSNRLQLTNYEYSNSKPAWSPDGKKIAFISAQIRNEGRADQICIMNTDGSNLINLTKSPPHNFNDDPAWSPDGTKIVFTSLNDNDSNFQIYIINADGTNQIRLTNDLYIDTEPQWSPDGTKITFESYRNDSHEIFSINSDGSHQYQLTWS
jgi:Tol biopolymer transport system component